MTLPFKWSELDKWLEDNKTTHWAHTDRYCSLRAFGPEDGLDEWLEEHDKYLANRNDRIINALKEGARKRRQQKETTQ